MRCGNPIAVTQRQSRERPACPLPPPGCASRKRHRAAAPSTGKAIGRMPPFVEPALCELVERPAPGPEWVHEVKFDGYRMQLRVENGAQHPALPQGPRLDATASRKSREACESLPDCIIDGEIVALDAQGAPSFAALQAALSDGDTDRLVFFVFDLLFADRRGSARQLPLVDRKARLRGAYRQAPAEPSADPLCRAFRNRRRCLAEVRLPDVARRHRLQARGCALSVRARRRLDEIQMPRRP